ncbi:hypothetical protein BO70DRAFT_358564 [Aspergillus heteromorphus CBS 117.55]|uniref:SP-RING-type domain-containing protein n=1 Tax=Aspergillus heteromorphus CBS 117.55 TaxID=1448321 RepID=A0A317X0M7_9EURO|nr:uncharacterized protein BO70DRAFT_358564 [Aspergillus heteromorphus CBS 117.55]PWY91132.1 hypothetical protein BO70DRAFT_358564 [Aspergillus heteromorphus CBS 117.55]
MHTVPMLQVNQQLFNHWRVSLESFASGAGQLMNMSEVVESPRIRLMQSSLIDGDPVFLAIHQMYCLSSFAPSELRKLPGFGPEQDKGLAVVKQLLVDNRRLSGDFLKWCVHFPEPWHNLVGFIWWRNALEQIMNSLVLLARNWESFERLTVKRGLPPLVEEIIMTFSIRSHAWQYIIFLALYRRLPGVRETNLFSIFNKDVKYTDDRLDGPRPVSPERASTERNTILSMYHKALVPPSSDIHSQTPAPASAPLPATKPPPPPTVPSSMPYDARVSSHPAMARNASHPTVSHMPAQYAQISPSPVGTPVPMAFHSQLSGMHSTQSPHMPAHQLQALQQAHPAGNIRSALSRRTSSSASSPHQMVFPSQLASPHPAHDPMTPASSVPAPAPAPALAPPGQRRRGRPPRAQTQAQFQAQTQAQNQSQVQAQIQAQARAQNQAPRMATGWQTRQAPPAQAWPLLLPPPGPLPPPTRRPDPIRDGLHVAHLRGPINLMVEQGPSGDKEGELYHSLHSFAAAPVALGQYECSFHWTFDIPRKVFDRLPKATKGEDPYNPTRTLRHGHLLLRLRSVKADPEAQTVAEETWCTTETTWPSVMYVFLNDQEMFVRRRQHNGKDLPLELTEGIQEGRNTLTIHLIRSNAEMRDALYAMGIEIMSIFALDPGLAAARILPAEESQKQILKRMTPDADDEISIVSDDLAINLVDPFTARIFNRPARGRFCTHQECFDHETFIRTRASLSKRRVLKEDWWCPICKKDARPHTLIIDGFLVAVHESLNQSGQLDGARAISVKRDGSWTLKTDADSIPEPAVASGSGSTSQSPHISAPTSPTTSTTGKRKSTDRVPSAPPASQRPKFERIASDIGLGAEPMVITLD